MRNLETWPGAQDLHALVTFLQADRQRKREGQGSYFTEDVYDPPCVSVNVSNPKYASAVEALINKAQLQVDRLSSSPQF